MADVQIWYDGNDHTVTLANLKNKTTGEYINDATVSVTINDSAGSPIAGSWPTSMPYVTSSKGKYRVALDYTTAMTVGSSYTAVITAVSASLNGRWEIDLKCQNRVR